MSYSRIIFAILIISLVLSAQNIDEAIRLFNSFQFERAREIFVEIVKDVDNPRIAEAYYFLGRLSIDPDSALSYYQRVTKNYSQSRYADISYLEIAKINIARGKYANAIITLSELLRNYPETSSQDEILFWLGISYMSNGQEKQGTSVLQDLRTRFPKSMWSERAANVVPMKKTPQTKEEYFTIQVGSYRNRENAEIHAEDLQRGDFDVQIVEAVVKGETYYRVWVGRFATAEQAKTFSIKLDSLGIKGNVVRGY